jgi:putative transposase
MPEILKAFKFRLYPTPTQEQLLNKTFGCVRMVWNQRVETFNNWIPNQVSVHDKTIKELKTEFNFLAEVPYNALEQKLQDWRSTKSQYFNKKRKIKLGRPQFKNRKGRQSFRLSTNGFSIKDNNVFAAKFGKLKLVGHEIDQLPLETCKQITISKDSTNKFFASILVQINVEPKPLTGKMVGIDLGLKELFILSDGIKIDNPKYFRENQAKLKKTQQHLSRKTKGSSRRNKQRIKVAKVHEKIKNQRKHLLHTVSTKLITDFDVICVENLNVKGMVKNHKLAKAISDASWSSFITMLDYKCNWYGKTLVKIDRFYPSSKTCSCCGYKVDKLGLEIRDWICPSCNMEHDRDINAAKNILAKGFSDLSGESIEFTGIPKKPVSVESIEYKRRAAIRLESHGIL